MKKIENMLNNELVELEKVLISACKRYEERDNLMEDSYLRIAHKKNRVDYYLKDKTSAVKDKGRYIKKSEIEIVRKIAQRDYDARVIKKAQERIKSIKGFLRKYKTTDLKALYNKTHPKRRELINIDIISDEEYIKRWSLVEYNGKSQLVEKEIITERGELVRSKSEKIIADKLYMMGIPYRYEYPLMLDDGITVYPDFTILKMPERKEVYLEHFGMMDDEEYVNKMLFKISTYERNGIFIGVNLFVTYETSKRPINTKALNNQLKELFL
ncbi:MAG: hypothetical protein IIW92_10085 [Lachnospiraceae bacterium]|nr:hypothetical protein [Lachnospiraceae bacterium]